jgi:hypothetical protein
MIRLASIEEVVAPAVAHIWAEVADQVAPPITFSEPSSAP